MIKHNYNYCDEERFYVYHLIDPRTNVPFYVGKGTGFRYYAHFSDNPNTCRNKRLFGHIKKMRAEGVEPIAIKIKENLKEIDAFLIEEQEIKKYGRIKLDEGGILFNLQEGGFGPPRLVGEDNAFYGRTHSEETKRIISENNKGRKRSEAHRQSISKAQKGVPKSEEHRRKIGEKSRGRSHTEEAKEKLANAFAKLWIITLPSGEEILVKNLNKFCKENGLAQGNMANVAAGKKNSCKGHKVRPYDPETDSIKFPLD